MSGYLFVKCIKCGQTFDNGRNYSVPKHDCNVQKFDCDTCRYFPCTKTAFVKVKLGRCGDYHNK